MASSPGLSLREIVDKLGGTIEGAHNIRAIENTRIKAVASLNSANKDQIAFFSDQRYRNQLAGTQAASVIMSQQSFDALNKSPCPTIVCDNPYAYYARLATMLNPTPVSSPGVHPSATSMSTVPASTHIGAGAVIGRGVTLGERVVIHPGAIVSDNVSIGNDCHLFPHSVLYAGIVLGERVIVHAGAVVGADGFGFAPDFKQGKGEWVKIPHSGRVIVGNDVEIGANTTIDRGSLEDTCIGNGVKIDNLVQIGHNCSIGEHTVIAACVGMAGSSVVGSHCQIGGAAMIAGHLEIADQVIVSPGTMIFKSIKKASRHTGIMPSDEHHNWTRNAAKLRRLDEMSKNIKQLQQEIHGTFAL